MGLKIKNRKVRIAIYVLIIVLMVSHLFFWANGRLQHTLDIVLTLLAGLRLWDELKNE